MPKEPHRPPATLAEAEERRRDLQHEISKIQAQLSEHNRVDSSGKRIKREDYLQWRRRAQYFLNETLSELRLLKRWIHDNRPPRPLFPALAEAVHLIEQLCTLVHELEEDGVDLDPKELRLVESARGFIARFSSTS